MSTEEWTGNGARENGLKGQFWSMNGHYWPTQDDHGHPTMFTAYNAFDEEGKWRIPISKTEWQRVWAAVCKAHPDAEDVFGGVSGFLRCVVGNMALFLLEQEDLAIIDPNIRVMQLVKKAELAQNRDQTIKTLAMLTNDSALSLRDRIAAGDEVMRYDEDVLERVLGVTGLEHFRSHMSSLHDEYTARYGDEG